jgi:hypothetical protein
MKMVAADNYAIAGKPEHADPSAKPVLLGPSTKRTANEALTSSVGTEGSSSAIFPSATPTAKEKDRSRKRHSW